MPPAQAVENSADSPSQTSGRPENRSLATAALLSLVLLLTPSGWFAWTYRSMPQLGAYHDDAVLWLSAQSLAEGHGYRIPQLPENPAQTKYPPLYPALLSLVWRLGSKFPENLPLLTLMQWLFVPLYLYAAWLYFRKCGFRSRGCFGLTTILAICPMTILFAVAPLTELAFSTVLLTLMLLLENVSNRNREQVAETGQVLLAGVIAAGAFLIRTNGVLIALSAPLLLILQRRLRSAIAFLCPLVLAIAGWQLWCLQNMVAAKSDIVSYYTSYLGFYNRTFSWPDLPHRLWVNFTSIVEALGQLAFFNVHPTYGVRVLEWLLTVIAISGVVTLFRNGHRHYPVFAALFVGLLTIWQYPSDTRFVFPLFPLYLAGLATKLHEVVQLGIVTWRDKGGADRVVAVVMVSLIMCFAVGSVGAAVHGIAFVLPEYFRDREKQRAEMLPAYRWIRNQTAPEARFSAYDDTLLYLNTQRHGYTPALLPRLVYSQNDQAIQSYVSGLDVVWRGQHIDYVLVTKYDFQRDLHQVALDSLEMVVEDRRRFQPVYADSVSQVYRLVDDSEAAQRD